jgi:hypothetical protein
MKFLLVLLFATAFIGSVFAEEEEEEIAVQVANEESDGDELESELGEQGM